MVGQISHKKSIEKPLEHFQIFERDSENHFFYSKEHMQEESLSFETCTATICFSILCLLYNPHQSPKWCRLLQKQLHRSEPVFYLVSWKKYLRQSVIVQITNGDATSVVEIEIIKDVQCEYVCCSVTENRDGRLPQKQKIMKMNLKNKSSD